MEIKLEKKFEKSLKYFDAKHIELLQLITFYKLTCHHLSWGASCMLRYYHMYEFHTLELNTKISKFQNRALKML